VAGLTAHDEEEEGRTAMRASVGDRIIIRDHSGDQENRDCEVLEVRGTDGEPPDIVRWGDSGHETYFFPGSDAVVEHFEHTRS
jgi:hypothetical protein